MHRSRQFYHCGNHFLVDLIGLQIARVDTVDLQVVDWQMLEACERTHAATEVVKRKLATNAVQHFDEALRLLHVRKNRLLRDFEAYCRRGHTATIQRFDDKTQECLVRDSLAGQVDRTAPLTSQPDFTT